MVQIFKLLLPALIPSWRFFGEIAPSPRIEFIAGDNDNWQEFPSRKTSLSLRDMFKKLFWNPDRNEALFMASCAERIMQNTTDHCHIEIIHRIRKKVNGTGDIQFRLIFWSRHNNEIQKDVIYVSPPYHADGY